MKAEKNVKNKEFINSTETMRKEIEKAPVFSTPNNSELATIESSKIEITQERYENLVACEAELKLLKKALSVVNSYDLSNVKKVFDIE